MLRILYLLFSIISECGTLQIEHCYRGSASLRNGEYMENYKLAEVYTETVHQCVKLCLSWTLCHSVNFNRRKHRCELNCMEDSETYGSMDAHKNLIYTDISKYPSVAAGQCESRPCMYDSMCVPDMSDGYKCIPIFRYHKEIGKIYSRYYDFENCLCGWKQDGRDNGNWKFKRGITRSDSTGPSGDHTIGNGTYIYMEASSLVHNHTVRLISDQLPANSNILINFWYHMWSNMTDSTKMGTLNLIIQNKVSSPKVLYSVSGNQGQEWKNAEVLIQSQPSVFVIIFEAVRGTGRSSDICLDDINIKSD